MAHEKPYTLFGVPISWGGIVLILGAMFGIVQVGINIQSDVSSLKERVTKLESQTEAVIRLSEQIKSIDGRICRIERYLRDLTNDRFWGRIPDDGESAFMPLDREDKQCQPRFTQIKPKPSGG